MHNITLNKPVTDTDIEWRVDYMLGTSGVTYNQIPDPRRAKISIAMYDGSFSSVTDFNNSTDEIKIFNAMGVSVESSKASFVISKDETDFIEWNCFSSSRISGLTDYTIENCTEDVNGYANTYTVINDEVNAINNENHQADYHNPNSDENTLGALNSGILSDEDYDDIFWRSLRYNTVNGMNSVHTISSSTANAGWYVPSMGEWDIVWYNYDEIQSALKAIKGTILGQSLRAIPHMPPMPPIPGHNTENVEHFFPGEINVFYHSSTQHSVASGLTIGILLAQTATTEETFSIISKRPPDMNQRVRYFHKRNAPYMYNMTPYTNTNFKVQIVSDLERQMEPAISYNKLGATNNKILSGISYVGHYTSIDPLSWDDFKTAYPDNIAQAIEITNTLEGTTQTKVISLDNIGNTIMPYGIKNGYEGVGNYDSGFRYTRAWVSATTSSPNENYAFTKCLNYSKGKYTAGMWYLDCFMEVGFQLDAFSVSSATVSYYSLLPLVNSALNKCGGQPIEGEQYWTCLGNDAPDDTSGYSAYTFDMSMCSDFHTADVVPMVLDDKRNTHLAPTGARLRNAHMVLDDKRNTHLARPVIYSTHRRQYENNNL